jgi:hypothetical protein
MGGSVVVKASSGSLDPAELLEPHPDKKTIHDKTIEIKQYWII